MFAAESDESLSLLSPPVLLEGGVGGLGTGAKPLCTARCGSLRICISDVLESGVESRGAWEPDTVICLFIGIGTFSGIYSLRLLFL